MVSDLCIWHKQQKKFEIVGWGMTTTHSSHGIWGHLPLGNLRLLLRLSLV